MKEWWTAVELIDEKLPELPGSAHGLRQMADRHGWQARRACGRRGGGREYALASLPEPARIELGKRFIAERTESSPESVPSAPAAQTASAAALPSTARGRAECRLEILAALRAFARAARVSEHAAVDAFVEAYNAGDLDVAAETREATPRLFVPTLLRWRRRHAKFGAAGVAGRYGNRRGSGIVDRDAALQSIVLGMISRNPNQIRVRRIHNLLRARHAAGEVKAIPSYSQLCAWVRNWRERNPAALENLANPDRARGRFRFAVGVAASEVVRPCQMFEFDNTKADVMLLVDGKLRRYAITCGIDIFSRRARAVVTPAPKAAASLACLRKMMRDFGGAGQFIVPDVVHTDNGSEFKARWFRAVLGDLEIEPTLRQAYHAWEGPFIESFNRTLMHGLCEDLDGYTGHNVAEAQAIRSRRTLQQRRDIDTDRRELILFRANLTPEDLQQWADRWISDVYENTPHRGLAGHTPRQMWNEYDGGAGPVRTVSDERRLDVLLAEVPGNGGMRMVGKQGILVSGFAFADSALAGLEGRRVYLRHDPSDIGRLWVFSEDHASFICIARNLDLMDVASRNDLARTLTSLQSMRTGVMRKRMRGHEKGVRGAMREVMDYYAANAPEIRAIADTEEHSTPAMVAAAIAASAAEADSRPAEPHHDAEMLAEGERLMRDAVPAASNLLTDEELWEKYLALRDIAPDQLSDADRFWMRSYESTPECRVNLELEQLAAAKIAQAG